MTRHLPFLSQLVLQLLQILHLLCLCLQENQPYLGLMGHLLAVRKLRHWGHRGSHLGVGHSGVPRSLLLSVLMQHCEKGEADGPSGVDGYGRGGVLH